MINLLCKTWLILIGMFGALLLLSALWDMSKGAKILLAVIVITALALKKVAPELLCD